MLARMPALERLLRHPGFPAAAVFAAALAVRGLALAWTADTPLAGDEREYFERASRIAAGAAPSPSGARAPGTELLLAGLFALFDATPTVARLGNAVLGAAGAAAVAVLGRQVTGTRCGAWLAGGLAALYPSLVAFSIGVWSEPLYLALVLPAIALLLRGPGPMGAVAAGALLGASVLTRESGLGFAVLALGWWAAVDRTPAGRGRAALAVGSLVACLLPWTWHINRGDEPFAPLTRTTWQNLYIGNAPPAEALAAGGRVVRVEPRLHYYALGETRGQMETAARALALDAIAERMPAWPFEKLASEVPRFVSPASFTQRRLLVDAGGPEGEWAYRFDGGDAGTFPSMRRAAAVGVAACYLAVAVAGVAGLGLLRDRRSAALLWLFLASQLLPCIVAFASTRFRVPSMAVLCVGCAVLAAEAGSLARDRRTLLALGLAAALGVGILAQAPHAWSPVWR